MKSHSAHKKPSSEEHSGRNPTRVEEPPLEPVRSSEWSNVDPIKRWAKPPGPPMTSRRPTRLLDRFVAFQSPLQAPTTGKRRSPRSLTPNFQESGFFGRLSVAGSDMASDRGIRPPETRDQTLRLNSACSRKAQGLRVAADAGRDQRNAARWPAPTAYRAIPRR